jgi:hypothetical protein
MRRIVTMHQPNYLPWIGLFSKIMQAECFVIADTFQYTNKGVIHRNKIRTQAGSSYLTIPISSHFRTARINEVELPQNLKWRNEHWRTIYLNYAKADCFKENSEFFEKLYQKDFGYLWQINMEIIRYLLESFNINVELIKASELNIDQNLSSSDLIIAVLKRLDGKIYLSGPSGRGYLELDKFRQNKIDVKFSKFNHPIYKQRYPGFEPYMSSVDLLFNTGAKSNEIIKTSGNIED